MAKIGIVADKYKEAMFRDELTKANIEFKIEPFGNTPALKQLIVITCDNTEQYIIGPITDKVTQYFIDNPPK